jgi:hypothetical protein
MSQSTGIAKTAGTIGSFLLAIGVLAFFAGIFGPVRNVLFVGIALILIAFAAFTVEELKPRG